MEPVYVRVVCAEDRGTFESNINECLRRQNHRARREGLEIVLQDIKYSHSSVSCHDRSSSHYSAILTFTSREECVDFTGLTTR